MSTLIQLQQQINEAEAKVNELRKKLDEERKTERAHAIATAKDLIKTHDLKASELGLSGKAPPKTPSKITALDDKRATVSPKYQDPTSGKTWTGRGKTPVWMATQLAGGRSREDFLI